MSSSDQSLRASSGAHVSSSRQRGKYSNNITGAASSREASAPDPSLTRGSTRHRAVLAHALAQTRASLQPCSALLGPATACRPDTLFPIPAVAIILRESIAPFFFFLQLRNGLGTDVRPRRSILASYTRLKGVERELSNLTLQLRVNVGPKQAALEFVRRKIEVQTEKAGAARERFVKAKQVMQAAEEELKKEEDEKDLLCRELQILVEQSSSAQLNKLEELKAHLAQLSHTQAPAPTPSQAPAPSPSPSPSPAQQQQPQQQEQPQQQAEATQVNAPPAGPAVHSKKGSNEEKAAPAKVNLSTAIEEAEKKKWAAEAAAARSRHLNLASPAPRKSQSAAPSEDDTGAVSKNNPSRQQQRQPRLARNVGNAAVTPPREASPGEFAGFDT
eukprot:gene21881-28911_t